jgi:hypothetical protein
LGIGQTEVTDEGVAGLRLLPDLKDLDLGLLLRYADDTRRTYESSMWIWSNGGRPSAILALELHPKTPPGPRWLYEIASLSTQPIAAERKDDLHWTAKTPGLVFAGLDDAEPVADKAARRLAQMKELRVRFTAHEQATIEGRIELRPLAAQLHRYESSDEDIVDARSLPSEMAPIQRCCSCSKLKKCVTCSRPGTMPSCKPAAKRWRRGSTTNRFGNAGTSTYPPCATTTSTVDCLRRSRAKKMKSSLL